MYNAINENKKFTPHDKTREKGYMYLGIYTLLIKEAFCIIHVIACDVASDIKLNITIPLSR
ncbi:hypothetical protein GCM10010912_52410 [Paenibacillus albidus]|uniref:Uncharacterized protein n=1 Tax=Paenibacillus albidus TaxID=2041023 RepID=A0A917CZK9_9BACL|nr:hypothetical protein GCM10010912_52410 [Paenibacillus albidus]